MYFYLPGVYLYNYTNFLYFYKNYIQDSSFSIHIYLLVILVEIWFSIYKTEYSKYKTENKIGTWKKSNNVNFPLLLFIVWDYWSIFLTFSNVAISFRIYVGMEIQLKKRIFLISYLILYLLCKFSYLFFLEVILWQNYCHCPCFLSLLHIYFSTGLNNG